MHLLTKFEMLASLLRAAGGEVVGKKKMQKLVYLAQEKGFYLGYDYEYHFHGVFCSELEADLRIAETFGVLNQEETELYGRPVRISINEDFVAEDEAAKERSDKEMEGLAVVGALKDESARVLEVLSTIVYLTYSGYTGAVRDRHLRRLKGHLSEYFDRAKKLFEEHFAQ